jgi:hypothetical protein
MRQRARRSAQPLGIMSGPLPLEDVLSRVATYVEYARVCESLNGQTAEEMFQALFPLAIHEGPASATASHMLVDLQPSCPIDLQELLVNIHSSTLDASNRSVPFYLVTQFGQRAILSAAAKFGPSPNVRSIVYWACIPAARLREPFLEWEDKMMDADDA